MNNEKLLKEVSKIPQIESQMDSNVQQIRNVTSCPNNYTGAICSFIDDDGGYYIADIWKPIIAEKNIQMGFAVVTGNIGVSLPPENPYRALTLEQIKQLQNEGHDIYSHTEQHKNTNTTSLAELDVEYENSQNYMKANGLNCSDVLVYPGGCTLTRVDIKNVARKYYNYAITITSSDYKNISPCDNWCVNRVNADTMTLDQLKAKVDESFINNDYLIFMNHAFELNKDKANQMQKIRDLIDYVRSKNIPIMKFSEAIKLKGNSIALGEYTDPNSCFIGVNGQVRSGVTVIQKGFDMTTPITAYKKGNITKVEINYLNDTLFGKGGIMEVYRHMDDSHSYAIFKPLRKNKLFIRKWNTTSSAWDSWEIESNFEIKTLNVGSNLDAPISEYQNNAITVIRIEYTKDTFRGKGGILTTYRTDEDTTAYQLYQIANEPKVFIRKWDNTSSTWKNWGVVGGYNFETVKNNGSILNNLVSDFIQNCVSEYIVETNASNPEGKGGLYKVYRYADDSYSYSEFKIWNSNVLYRRRWNGTTWTTWEKVSVV